MVGVAPFANARVELARMPDRLLGGGGRLLELPAVGGEGRLRVEVTGPVTSLSGEVPFTLCESVSAPVPSASFVEQTVSLPGPPHAFDVRVAVPSGWTARPGTWPGETFWFAEDGATRFTVVASCPNRGCGGPAAKRALEDEIASFDNPIGGATSEVLRTLDLHDGVAILWTSGGEAFPERLHADVLRWGKGLPAPVRCSLETMPYFAAVAEAALAACAPLAR
jgi:hypothetical protein